MSFIVASAAGAKDHSPADYLPRWATPQATPDDVLIERLRALAQRRGDDGKGLDA